MDVCPHFIVFMLSCVGSILATGLITRPRVIPTVYKIQIQIRSRLISNGKRSEGLMQEAEEDFYMHLLLPSYLTYFDYFMLITLTILCKK
jgi:hypothetical protein